jgi:DNA invertase Pin-like site-specific DNA recombinase
MDRIYIRVSSKQHDQASQLHALAGQAGQRYEDTATGKTMDRPNWERLMADLKPGDRLIVWRLDRLGRTASGLTALFEELVARKVTLVSLKEGIDLSKAAGRMMANVLASVAAAETELRGEQVRAGLQAARAAGKRLGGGKAGRRVRVTPEKEQAAKAHRAAGMSISAIARLLGLSRPTVYAILG